MAKHHPVVARPLRLEAADAIYHVTARGNARGHVFRGDRDYGRFLDLLGRVVDRFGWRVYAYCLLGNHYHLLFQTPEPNLCRGMRHLNGVYAQWFNKTHRRVGHVFQGRFKAILVSADSHLLELSRYIVLNPVRGRLCARPEEWRWSSYGAAMGLAPSPPYLDSEWLLANFQHNRRVYQEYVLAGVGVSPPSVIADLYAGDEAFAEQHAPFTPIREVPIRHWRPTRPPLSELLTSGDEESIRAAYRHGYTLTEIGTSLGIHYTTVSRRLLRAEQLAHRKT